MKGNLLILYSYNNFFAGKYTGTIDQHEYGTMDVNRLSQLFRSFDFHVEISEVSRVDFEKDYSDWYVVYSSSEDPGMFYKEYIEDVLCALKNAGATLIPKFKYFRAHNNKSFEEMLRQQFRDEDLKYPRSYSIGHFDEIVNLKDELKYPVVIKVSNGSGSKGVELVHNWEGVCKVSKKLMTHVYRDFSQPIFVRLDSFLRKVGRDTLKRKKGVVPLIDYIRTNKIILQEYIPNLSGDYKVLYFFGKYFVLNRLNRENDFRASGSGKFIFPQHKEEVLDVLNLARKAVKEIGTPLLSLDIGSNDNGCYLIEFQTVCFGPYTLQFAPMCLTFENDNWIEQPGEYDLEEEYVRSISEFIKDIGY